MKKRQKPLEIVEITKNHRRIAIMSGHCIIQKYRSFLFWQWWQDVFSFTVDEKSHKVLASIHYVKDYPIYFSDDQLYDLFLNAYKGSQVFEDFDKIISNPNGLIL